MMPTIADLETELQGHDANLAELDQILAMMPDNQDALDMKADVLAQKQEVQNKIALLKPNDAATATANDTQPPPMVPSPASDTTTAAAARGQAAPQDAPQYVFKVNENVVAKYGGDRQFYPATIIAVMGSGSAPVYTVKFKGYSGTETVRWKDVKPSTFSSSAGQKRKADDSPTVSTPVPPSPSPAPPMPTVNTGSVISAPAKINTALAAQIKNEPSKLGEGAPRADKPTKKVKTNKALDKAQGSWQDWQKKSGANSKVAKVANKESMFRTGHDHTARVGFTGSGKTMTKDIARAKHIYDDRDRSH